MESAATSIPGRNENPLQVSMKRPVNDREQLQQVANGFEEMFLRNFMKSARASMPKSSDKLFGSSALDQFTSMLDEHYARDLSGKLGVADRIVKQLEHYLPNNSTSAEEQ